MFGLKRNLVQVVGYRPEWRASFENEASNLRALIGDMVVDIQHVGSTAIPDMPAKPILDIAIAVAVRAVIPLIVLRLCQHGYIDGGDGSSEGGYFLIRESQPNISIVHLHIVEVTDGQWRNFLRFREILLANPQLHQRYATLKQQLAEYYPDDRDAYTAAKAALVREVLAQSEE